MKSELNESYWTSRYETNEIGWDIGKAAPPIQQYLDQITRKDLKILIPGAGNAYEAAYAFQNGFEYVHVLDISAFPLKQFKEKYPQFPSEHLHHEDFFNHASSYDLILEQTFFCALPIDLRPAYVQKMKKLLKEGGKLVGLLFSHHFPKVGPPFGGTKAEYLAYFEPHFEVVLMEPCYNSIPPRMGEELFFMLKKKQ
ncbi:methyltransferase [Pararhodonellum marinum]|uniref:methyltransferase n=1 Tax=Pararhodonellum marinum TaxID=2755358 RepID=UPI00188F3C6A|nr:methyltransferase [Pararhodonellum marinum]